MRQNAVAVMSISNRPASAANHQSVNAAGEQEPASGVPDNLPHLGPVAHVRFPDGDGFRAPVLV